MRKNPFNGLSPSLSKFNQASKRKSIKENLIHRMGRSLTQMEATRVLQVKKLNESNSTNKNTEENSSFHLKEPKPTPITEEKCEIVKNLDRIKNSIREIREESIKTQTELINLKKKLGQNLSFKELNKRRDHHLSESSKNSEIPNLGLQIKELKVELSQMNQRLLNGAEMIKVKTVENVSLQYTVFNLKQKLNKIRRKRDVVESSTCKLCQIF